MFIEMKNRAQIFPWVYFFAIFQMCLKQYCQDETNNFFGQYLKVNSKMQKAWGGGAFPRCVCWGAGGEGRRRGFENGGLPTKTYDVLQMLIDQNYTMFFNIENDYYR